MEDIGLFKQGWQWLRSQKDACWRARIAVTCCRDKSAMFIERHWPMVCSGCSRLGSLLRLSLIFWKDSALRGFQSFIRFGSVMLLLIMWSCFLSLTSMHCLIYVLLSMGVAGVAVQYLGYTPGIFIVGLFAILILWMYANFWITGSLLLVGGYLFSLNHARLVVLLGTAYAVYCVQVRVGWLGVFLAINLAFLSNDILNFLLQWFDNLSESSHSEEQKQSETIVEDDFSEEYEYSTPSAESENLHSCKSSSKPAVTTSVVDNKKELSANKVVREQTSSIDEMRRISKSLDHYEALGFTRHKKIDAAVLKKEYRKKAMLVHPDKNMGSSLASESFKKLQCAYEVLSDSVKKRDYDEQLRKEESMAKTVCQKSHGSSRQDNPDYRSEESRRIQCTKCGNSHIWVCTNRSKAKARWCQDCCQFHQAKDGDGWVEYKGSLIFDRPQKVEIPRAFVCAESKIFDVSEWAICQFYTQKDLMSNIEDNKEQGQMDVDASDESANMPSSQMQEETIKKKYGGIVPKKPPLISKDHERAYFDSADWALGKQGGEKPKGPLEALRPKLQPTQQQTRYRKSPYAPSGEEGGSVPPEDAPSNE